MSASAMLSDVAELVMGQSPPSASYNETGDGLPFYQGKTDFGATYPTPRIYCRDPKKIAEAGDILMSVRAPVGATNLSNGKACIGRGIAAIRPHGIDRDFLYFYLKKIETYIDSLGSGAIFKAINKSQLAELPINDAGIELSEQKKIAQILSTVQRAIEEQERIIQTTTELKKALMQKLFTEGLRNEPQKQTEIGPVPQSWEIKTVGDYCNILNGFAFKSEDYVANGGIPNFRVVNISWDGTVSMDDCKFLPESFTDSHEKYLLNEGDILFVMVGATRGKLAQIPASILPALMNQNMWRIVPSRAGIDRDFLFYHLRRSVVGLLQEDDDQARGFFKKSDFRDLPLAIPSLQEQIEIRNALGTLETKLGQHAAKVDQLKHLFRTILHELMTAKTRVHRFEFS
jgi:type I restriction enzyme S subunit